ncbi:heme NO-binding domain-containing protein [Legionella gresilensis]|uniref:heme NO-binding domain-containing protein n=1 Tax=Legionella gresilensis TaxID=91823 RepID=UPI0013EF7052|nr:heme NO-binding domain-containing protein [Legionella gresilensis]
MKGIIFSNFLEMVAEVFSPEMVETIIEQSNLSTQGAYTDIGTYDHQELLRLIKNLSLAIKIPISQLQIEYGKYLFNKFLNRYKDLIQTANSTFKFLQQVDNHIHVEVRKLYPEAELPRFECNMLNDHVMTMKYSSNHPFADLAEGLILGCSRYFKENIQLTRQELKPEIDKKYVMLFTLEKRINCAKD